MAITPAGTVLVEKETSYTSIYTYYKATLETAPTVQNGKVNFNVRLQITLGSGTGLGTGSGNNRTAFIYNSSGELIGSQLIKNNVAWTAGNSYAYIVSCAAPISSASGTLNGCYIRVKYSRSQDYGDVASCYWNGSSGVSGGSVGNTFSISYEGTAYTLTVEAGNGIASVSGGGNYPAGISVTVNCVLENVAGYTTTFSKWASSNPSILADGQTQAYTFNMPSGNVTLTAQATLSGNTYTITFDPNGGTVSPTSKTVTYWQPYGVLPTPTNGAKVFAGWQDSEGNIITAESIVQTASNQTLTAQWKIGVGRIYVDGSFQIGSCYVYHNGAWVNAMPYIYHNGSWMEGV